MIKARRLVNRFTQGKIIAGMVGLSSLVIAAFYFSNLYYYHYYLNQGLTGGLPESHIFFLFLNSQHEEMNQIFLITSIGVTLVTLIFGAFFSGTIARILNRFKYVPEKTHGTSQLATVHSIVSARQKKKTSDHDSKAA